MSTDRSAVSEAWEQAQAALPPGWDLDGLRCASSGLSPDERSEEWIAVAVGPAGQEIRHQAADPTGALGGLVEALRKGAG